MVSTALSSGAGADSPQSSFSASTMHSSNPLACCAELQVAAEGCSVRHAGPGDVCKGSVLQAAEPSASLSCHALQLDSPRRAANSCACTAIFAEADMPCQHIMTDGDRHWQRLQCCAGQQLTCMTCSCRKQPLRAQVRAAVALWPYSSWCASTTTAHPCPDTANYP